MPPHLFFFGVDIFDTGISWYRTPPPAVVLISDVVNACVCRVVCSAADGFAAPQTACACSSGHAQYVLFFIKNMEVLFLSFVRI